MPFWTFMFLVVYGAIIGATSYLTGVRYGKQDLLASLTRQILEPPDYYVPVRQVTTFLYDGEAEGDF